MIENRELAKHVVEIRQYADDHAERHKHDLGIIKAKECRQILATDIKLHSNIVEVLVDGLSSENPNGDTDEVYFMLLLALCPQVKILRLEGELGVLRAMPCLNETLISTVESRLS